MNGLVLFYILSHLFGSVGHVAIFRNFRSVASCAYPMTPRPQGRGTGMRKKAVSPRGETASCVKLKSAGEMRLFARGDGAAGAYIGARAAIDAGTGVDGIFFTFGDGAAGAFVDARAAGNAVVTDYVSHLFLNLNCY